MGLKVWTSSPKNPTEVDDVYEILPSTHAAVPHTSRHNHTCIMLRFVAISPTGVRALYDLPHGEERLLGIYLSPAT